ncbi:transcriptional regulator, MarR family [Janthinobacterium sp. Marseille]|uniref:Winged helix-turn-helix transcriptional regulator n=1 Tax=Herminiimonas aquatilis TaxID=345342 RepID=A0ABW2J5T7_9BURK|nr:helix-turn-helix domain-containing protein [Janthinobacterium sp. Marseille]ABR91386.1 transcriptional regulator, MarR family [Janthinobacterium sp. Marseille]
MKSSEFKFPIDATIFLIGGKWKCSILCYLFEQPHRTGELRRAMADISQKVLTEQLRELESDGIIERTVYPEVPPRVEYKITDFGLSLEKIITAMCDWGHDNIETVTEARQRRLATTAHLFSE